MSLKTELYDYGITDDEIFAEEDMPESPAHANLIMYLTQLLKWYYRKEGWFIGSNLAIVYAHRKYLAPDLALFRGVVLSAEELGSVYSYRLNPHDRPVPNVIFEISSKDTWKQDLREKPDQYGEMGAAEYFAYDPHQPQSWKRMKTRLKGWRYENGVAQELLPNEQGWLWSNELGCWLAPEGAILRLKDTQLRNWQTEAESLQDVAEILRNVAESKEAEYLRLLEKLRKANIDPDSL
jgi:Uma2 family endonuclease